MSIRRAPRVVRFDAPAWRGGLIALLAILTSIVVPPVLATESRGCSLPCPGPSGPTTPILVLSGRGDLVTGGDALIEILLRPEVNRGAVRVDLDGRRITSSFADRENGRFMGLVTDMTPGEQLLRVRVGSTEGGQITLTNHPETGPVITGPQIQPWICTTDEHGLGPPIDPEHCHAETVYRFYYKSSADGRFHRYDPDAPPPDVDTTTTQSGETLPYIVRVERGTIARGIYDIATLFQPDEPWEPWAPQNSWNRAVLWLFGDGTTPSHVQGAPPDVLDDMALSRGFMVAGSGLNVHGQNANDVASAEALMMVREHLIENYGDMYYTIGRGRGCGEGSLLQVLAATNYPGLIHGLILECGLPDLWTVFTEHGDCSLLVGYFNETSPELWASSRQRAAVAGHSTPMTCKQLAQESPIYFDPTKGEGCGGNTWTYDPELNPDGERCLIQDYQKAIFGARLEDGFAPRPYDNAGVQFGLQALRNGEILPEQFVDLNENIGCLDLDGEFRPARCSVAEQTLAFTYRSGRVASGPELAKVPIVELRGSARTVKHHFFRSLVLRARLDRDLGYHDHHVIWGYPGRRTPPDVAEEALLLVQDWLAGVFNDLETPTREESILVNRPAKAVDSCFPDAMTRVEDDTVCGLVTPDVERNPRVVAGAPITSDVLKCLRKPLDRDDYADMPVPFTDQQWARLEATFADGVCDYAEAGVQQQPPAGPWQSFAAGPGGTPLGPAPSSEMLETRAAEQRDMPTPSRGGALTIPSLLLLAGLLWCRRVRPITKMESFSASCRRPRQMPPDGRPGRADSRGYRVETPRQ